MKTRNVIGTVVTALLVGVCACTQGTDTDTEKSGLVAEQFEPGQGMNLGRSGQGREIDIGHSNEQGGMAELRPEEIASILLVLNQGEVAQARIAERQAQSAPVRRYARMMLDDHSKAADRLESGPLGRLGGSKRDATASILERQGQLLTRDLEGQPRELFDLAYMTTQVMAHAKLLGLIDNVLLTGGADGRQGGYGERIGQQQQEQRQLGRQQGERGMGGQDELSREVMQMRDLVEHHLQQALRIHAELRNAERGERGRMQNENDSR